MAEDDFVETITDINNVSINIKLPKLVKWSGKQLYDYTEHVIDYETIEQLGESITQARYALFVLTDKINKYDRLAKEAKISYERAYRREYLSATDRTETAKKARAELKCEELENTWIKYDQLTSELNRMSQALRNDLQALQTIGNNLRQQLKVY